MSTARQPAAPLPFRGQKAGVEGLADQPKRKMSMTVIASLRQGGAALALASLLAFSFSPAPVFADDAPAAVDGSPVAATVNGEAITEADIAQAAQDFRDQLQQSPPEQWHDQLLNILIEIKLMSKAAVDQGLDKDPAAAKRLKNANDRALRLEFLRAKVVTPITEDDVHKAFDEELAKFAPADEYKASHILVKTEDEAKAIIADLDKGGDFAAIAKEKSGDPGSKDNGGDLGFFKPSQMVKPFADAVTAIPAGSYSKTPVQSPYGWHVIKVFEVRKEQPPTFEERAPEIRNKLITALFTSTIDGLKDSAKIEIVKATPAEPAPAAPSGDAAVPATPAPAAPAQ
jgi:peptidyl-prolyl cis-trans isomerase C